MSTKSAKTWKNRIKIAGNSKSEFNGRSKVDGNKVENKKIGDNKFVKKKNH